ncbi:MAG: L-aspartate oxidase [Pseudomonadota bacterium]
MYENIQHCDAVDVLIVGAGAAGLYTALKCAPYPVTIITSAQLSSNAANAASFWAQGGIAAALGKNDHYSFHARDTITAGAGLVDAEAARILCKEAPGHIEDLLALGVPFDSNNDGSLKLGREAAHSHDRIVHASGDKAGAAVMSALIAAARTADHITIMERIIVEDLLVDDNQSVCGALVYDIEKRVRGFLPASATILATGGIGGLYSVTTNPVSAQGQGLAIAARCGASIRDAEFIQFHPTAIDIGKDPAPLATEALRGAGAILVNRDGRRFTGDYHHDKELAPRDIVARAVEAEHKSGRGAFLDARSAIGDDFPQKFPAVYSSLRQAGYNPCTQLFPIAPACHYHMGGVRTDIDGRSTINGLWAVGEVASAGIHGANRLASNSLLEAFVFGHRVALDVLASGVHGKKESNTRKTQAIANSPSNHLKRRLTLAPSPAPRHVMKNLRDVMGQGCALIRSSQSLNRCRDQINKISGTDAVTSGLDSALTVANIVLHAAIFREESRGSHFRSDFPNDSLDTAHSIIRLKSDRGGWAFEVRKEPIGRPTNNSVFHDQNFKEVQA